MKLLVIITATIVYFIARCAFANPTSSRTGESSFETLPTSTPANLLSAPRGVLNPADQSMFFLHEFPMHDKLTTHLRYHDYEEEYTRTGELYWAFVYRKVFDRPFALGRVLVRGPRQAHHVRCAFLDRLRKDDAVGDNDGDSGRAPSKDVKVDEDGLVEKLHFSWNHVVAADEPYSGIICRMYFDLDDLKFGPDTTWP